MELFAELVPSMKRVGVLRNPNNPGVTMALRETEDAIRKLHMQVQIVDAQTPDEFERDWNSCVSWYRRPLASLCSIIQPMSQPPRLN